MQASLHIAQDLQSLMVADSGRGKIRCSFGHGLCVGGLSGVMNKQELPLLPGRLIPSINLPSYRNNIVLSANIFVSDVEIFLRWHL